MFEIGMRFLLGAYAAFPGDSDFSGSPDECGFYQRLRGIDRIDGLEIPFKGTLHPKGLSFLADQLKPGWKITATLIPGQMAEMEKDLHYGLASLNDKSRARAVEHAITAWRELQSIKKSRPDVEISALQIHTGPRGEQASPQAFSKSLSHLCEDTALRARLQIEHCDAWTKKQPVSKGFLSVDDEINQCKKHEIGILINWGRSRIEGQSDETPNSHLREANAGGVLRGLIFSGASLGQELYGNTFRDSHAPFLEGFPRARGDAHRGLALTKALATQALREARKSRNSVLIGLKMQPLPKSLGIQERISFINKNLEILAEAYSLSSSRV